jgi:hypothetical protein
VLIPGDFVGIPHIRNRETVDASGGHRRGRLMPIHRRASPSTTCAIGNFLHNARSVTFLNLLWSSLGRR